MNYFTWHEWSISKIKLFFCDRIIIPVRWILPIAIMRLKMFCSCKELYISGFTLILRIHFGTLHMLPFKSFALFIISSPFFKNVLLLLRRPLSCAFTFLYKFKFLIPCFTNCFVSFYKTTLCHRITLLCQVVRINHLGKLQSPDIPILHQFLQLPDCI